MTPVRIFVDAHAFDDAYQGTTSYISRLYNELVKDESFEITLAANDLDRLRRIFVHPRFSFVKLPSGGALKRLVKHLPALLKRGKYHFAHFQYMVPPVGSTRFINTIHDLLFLDHPGYFPWNYRLTRSIGFRVAAKRSHLICTVSDYSRRAIARHFGFDEKEICVTPNTVDIFDGAVFDPRPGQGIGNYLLYVSRFEPRKNHISLLSAFAGGLHHEYHLVLIGRRRDVPNHEYETGLAALPPEIRKKVLHLEDVPPRDLHSWYAYASLFVYPSLAEGFGIPPLEAAVARCKVVCSRATAMSDFDFFGRYLFDPENIEELKVRINEALADGSYDVEGIRSEVLSRFNRENVAREFGRMLKLRLHDELVS